MTRDPVEEALFLDREAADPDAPVSHYVAIQRVVVRMLFDPAFVQRVYESPDETLRGLDLDRGLVDQLLLNDRRLWNADRLRRSRALKILLDEFKTSSTLALHEVRELAFLDAFFSSDRFHAAVQRRGYMAVAFAGYLEDALAGGRLASSHLRCALTLEAAMARSRRALRDARRGRDPAVRGLVNGARGMRRVVLPGIAAVFLPAGALELVQHVERYLFEIGQVPALALCTDAPSPDPLPALSASDQVPYLLEPRVGGKVDLSVVGREFALVVQACESPVDDDGLAAAMSDHGISREDALDQARQLLDGGVLRRV
jgi:hypothetical protein